MRGHLGGPCRCSDHSGPDGLREALRRASSQRSDAPVAKHPVTSAQRSRAPVAKRSRAGQADTRSAQVTSASGQVTVAQRLDSAARGTTQRIGVTLKTRPTAGIDKPEVDTSPSSDYSAAPGDPCPKSALPSSPRGWAKAGTSSRGRRHRLEIHKNCLSIERPVIAVHHRAPAQGDLQATASQPHTAQATELASPARPTPLGARTWTTMASGSSKFGSTSGNDGGSTSQRAEIFGMNVLPHPLSACPSEVQSVLRSRATEVESVSRSRRCSARRRG